MHNMFKNHILVAEALSRNSDECWEICVHCVRIDVSELQAWHSVHAPFFLYRSQRPVEIPSVILFPGISKACVDKAYRMFVAPRFFNHKLHIIAHGEISLAQEHEAKLDA